MKSVLRSLVVLLSCLAIASPLAAGKPPRIAFDSDQTPLQKAIAKANRATAEKKKGKLGPGEKKDKCAAALSANDAAGIAKWCDVATATTQKIGHQDFQHADGKAAGKRVVTKTVLEYENANQKAGADDGPVTKWASPKLKAFERGTAHTPGPASGSSRGAALFPSTAVNDDGDCVDWVTGERLGGAGIADGSAQSCFADSSKKLKATLTVDASAGTCRHTSGSVFFGNATDNVEDDC